MSSRLEPPPNPTSEPYWEAARNGILLSQRCDACSRFILYPRGSCPYCGNLTLSWEQVSGHGTVFTYTIARRPTHPAFTDQGPYVIAIVELTEGPRLTTRIVGCAVDDVHIDMPVRVDFEDLGGDRGVRLPVFRPAG